MTTPQTEKQARTGLEIAGTQKVRRNLEAELQMAIVDYVRKAAPKQMFFSVPNHGKRSKASGGREKAMGLRPGVPDLCFIVKKGYAAFMELKVGRNRLSPEQEAFALWCEDNLVPFAVVTNMDTAIAVLKGWGVVR